MILLHGVNLRNLALSFHTALLLTFVTVRCDACKAEI